MSQPSEHTARIRTAAIMLAVIAIIAWLDVSFITWLFLGAIYAVALSEALPLFRIGETAPYLYGAALWLISGLYPHPIELLALVLLVWAGWLAYRRTADTRTLLPLLYPTLGMLFLWALYDAYGMASLGWLLLIVALTDVGAYYTGRAIGKTPFSPTSPNKTLEGVVGGVLAGTIGGIIWATNTMDIGFWVALVASIVTAKFSVFGDLFESYLKREAGIKDSGTILPGHGGVLDRIDGYLFGSISLYVLLHVMGV